MAENDTLLFANDFAGMEAEEDDEQGQPDDPSNASPGQHDAHHHGNPFDSVRRNEVPVVPQKKLPEFTYPDEPKRINGKRLTANTRKRDRDMLTAFN